MGLPPILLLAANPKGTARLEDEHNHLQDRLAPRGLAGCLRHRPRARAGELMRLLQDDREVRIVHFSGHGTPDGSLLFESESGAVDKTDTDALGAAFAALADRLEGVFLNACHSAEQAERISEHVEWLVAMADAVEDALAVEFAGDFYVELADRGSVEHAFRVARARTGLANLEQARAPRLYRRGKRVEVSIAPARAEDETGLDSPSSEPSATELVLESLETDIARRTLAGEDTSELGQQLLALRRTLREGVPLNKGDTLAGRYELGDEAGRGGFATVWKAWDTERKQLVAVKVLHGQWSGDRSRRARFEAGTRRMNELDHPALVRVLDMPRDADGFYFYVLPWYAKGDLRAALAEGRSDRETALRGLVEVLEGLAFAHARGVVHRDIKPGNILIDEVGRAVLSDFDLARAEGSTQGTRTGAMGTFVYAAPEQLKDASRVDAKADLYSIGLTVMFVLAGEDPPVLVSRAEPEYFDALDCGEALRGVLRRAVAYKPAQRTTSCLELAAAIRAELARVPVELERETPETAREVERSEARPEPEAVETPEVAAPPDRPWRKVALGVGVVAVLATLGFFVGPRLWGDSGTEPEPRPIETHEPQPSKEQDKLIEDVERDDESETSDTGSVEPGEGLTVKGVELALIPAGRFMMGSPKGEGASDEHPQHVVVLDSFYMAKTEVTNDQYAMYLDANPDARKPRYWSDEKYNQPNQPVVGVSWDEAKAYCDWAGLKLPTEAQWEYAARAGTQTKYWSGAGSLDLAHVGWYEDNSGGRLHPVGEKPANEFGLHDVHGNVWEWCLDGWGAGYDQPVRGGDGLRREPDVASYRVFRGGSWFITAGYARSTNRSFDHPGDRNGYVGFRPVQAIP